MEQEVVVLSISASTLETTFIVCGVMLSAIISTNFSLLNYVLHRYLHLVKVKYISVSKIFLFTHLSPILDKDLLGSKLTQHHLVVDIELMPDHVR